MPDHPKKEPENDSNGYTVGYGHPPQEHQFKPGNNANPRGRKKGSKNRTLVIRQIFFEPITVREGDEVKRMPVLEAIVRQTCNKALKGDYKAALTIIGLAQKEGLLTPEQNEAIEENMSDADKAILADYKKRMSSTEM
jgi:hypothetical protein